MASQQHSFISKLLPWEAWLILIGLSLYKQDHLPPWVHWLTSIVKIAESADVIKYTETTHLDEADMKGIK